MRQQPAAATPSSARRAVLEMSFALYLIGLAVIAMAFISFARKDELRLRLDATKTRAYSLSQQTRAMLEQLQGEWQVALIYGESQVDRATRKQIDEVLKQFSDTAGDAGRTLTVSRIDPADPAQLAAYDAVLVELRQVYQRSIDEYNAALDFALQAYRRLQLLGQQHAAALADATARLPQDDPSAADLVLHAQSIAMLDERVELISKNVRDARQISDTRPLPDFETARSVLAAELHEWALSADDLASMLKRWPARNEADATVRQLAHRLAPEFESIAVELADAADRLKRLPPNELGAIGEQLGRGEAAVIIAPNRATVIPSVQLFPKSNIAQKQDGGISFDQRFRGEQIIAAAMRSLTVVRMPRVVFVHAGAQTLLRSRENGEDLTAVAMMLRQSRYDVAEWLVTKNPLPPEPAAKDQATVWVVVPPLATMSRDTLATTEQLVEAVNGLLAKGEPVLLNLHPSILARYGQADPIQSLAAPFGLAADTSRILLEIDAAAQTPLANHALQDFPHDHPIARALNGQMLVLVNPVRVFALPEMRSAAEHFEIATIQPGANRWFEQDWVDLRKVAERRDAGQPRLLSEPAAAIMAAQRPHPANPRAKQRFMLVGSVGWMSSVTADHAVSLGGERIALKFPGNYELMLSSIAWLAGMDELIAAGPVGQEVGRLQRITPQQRTMWSWFIIAGLPAACLMLGVVVACVRRHA